MKPGFDQPLYVLPFDHRRSYGEQVFGFKDPMTAEQVAVVAASKRVIYEGFEQAVSAGAPKDRCGILVDEEFGAAVLHDAAASGYITCMPTEKSGQHEFDFEYGPKYAEHIAAFNPTFTKVLVRYNPDGDAALNARQLARLKILSDYLRQTQRLFMFELLVPAEKSQLDKLGGDKKLYDRQLRPELMVRSIHDIQDAGIEPDVWKVEGLERHEDCTGVVAAARRGGRDRVGSIVLGRGEDEKKVLQWLTVAASVPGFIGFAVGRSTFLDPIVQMRAGQITGQAASAEVARRFAKWIKVFEEARAA